MTWPWGWRKRALAAEARCAELAAANAKLDQEKAALWDKVGELGHKNLQLTDQVRRMSER